MSSETESEPKRVCRSQKKGLKVMPGMVKIDDTTAKIVGGEHTLKHAMQVVDFCLGTEHFKRDGTRVLSPVVPHSYFRFNSRGQTYQRSTNLAFSATVPNPRYQTGSKEVIMIERDFRGDWVYSNKRIKNYYNETVYWEFVEFSDNWEEEDDFDEMYTVKLREGFYFI